MQQFINNESKEKAFKEFQQIPGVGEKIAEDFWELGISSPGELIGKNPEVLYLQLCTMKGMKVDRCMLYVFRCAVYFVSHIQHDPALLNWWVWKDDSLIPLIHS